jgi:hypothetical protein
LEIGSMRGHAERSWCEPDHALDGCPARAAFGEYVNTSQGREAASSNALRLLEVMPGDGWGSDLEGVWIVPTVARWVLACSGDEPLPRD